jgi:hypothetical protein
MTGDELETLLSRYQPAGPPEALRDRILRSGGLDDRSSRPLWLAISALAACVVLFVGGASRAYKGLVRPTMEAAGQERAAQIETTAAMLGGGPLGHEQAVEALVLAESENQTALQQDLGSR